MFVYPDLCISCGNCVFQIGGTYARPVILPPMVAIGAIGKIQVGRTLISR